MRHPLAAAILFCLGCGAQTNAVAGNGNPANPNAANVLTIAVYGDAPYGTTPNDTSEFTATPAFIDSINSDPHVDLVIHVGDIHSGTNGRTATRKRRAAASGTRAPNALTTCSTPTARRWTTPEAIR